MQTWGNVAYDFDSSSAVGIGMGQGTKAEIELSGPVESNPSPSRRWLMAMASNCQIVIVNASARPALPFIYLVFLLQKFAFLVAPSHPAGRASRKQQR